MREGTQTLGLLGIGNLLSFIAYFNPFARLCCILNAFFFGGCFNNLVLGFNWCFVVFLFFLFTFGVTIIGSRILPK